MSEGGGMLVRSVPMFTPMNAAVYKRNHIREVLIKEVIQCGLW